MQCSILLYCTDAAAAGGEPEEPSAGLDTGRSEGTSGQDTVTGN